MNWADWSGFLRDLTMVSGAGALVVYALKLFRPAHAHDRLGALALALATAGPLLALILGIRSAERLDMWAVYALPLLALYWLFEQEFGTRILGLPASIALIFGLVLVPLDHSQPMAASAVAVGSVSGALGLSIFAVTVPLLDWLYRPGTGMTARRTGRFFAVSRGAIAEIAFRLVAWAMPFIVAAAIALTLDRPLPLPLAALVLSAVLGVSYLVRSRAHPYEVGLHPWLLATLAVTLLASAYGLDLLSWAF